MNTLDKFREIAKAAGATDLPRVFASGKLAVINGDSPESVLAALRRNRPEFFKSKR